MHNIIIINIKSHTLRIFKVQTNGIVHHLKTEEYVYQILYTTQHKCTMFFLNRLNKMYTRPQ